MHATLNSPASSRLRLTLACNIEKVRPLSLAVRDFLTRERVSESDLMACELAVAEACNNAVLYATESGQRKPIEIEVDCDSTAIQMRLYDHTSGFQLPEKIELPGADQERGRGLFIIHSLMDKMEYNQVNGANCLFMQRRRADAPPSVSDFSPERFQEFTRRLAESEQVITDMAEELSSCYESLSAIFRCGAELGKTNDLKEFTESLCHDLLQITGADWYLLRTTAGGDTSRLDVFAASDPSLHLPPVHLGLEPAVSAEVRAALSRQDVWFSAIQPLEKSDPLARSKPECFGVVHPFFFAENLMGTLAVGKTLGQPPFTAAQANVVHTFADFLAIQIVNFRLREEQITSKLISRELEIARTIQHALLPRTLPRMGDLSLAGFCESARQVGGDFYDVVQVDDKSLLLIIADVMGKGIPAAMFAAILRSVLRATPEFNHQPAALLSRVNRLLFDELSEVEMFITAQVACIDVERRQLTAASAGHCPVLVAAPGLPSVKTISPDGLPLGILPDARFSDQTEPLPPGCRVLLYTDGLTDAPGRNGELFGQQRLLDWFANGISGETTADRLRDSLVGELRRFQAGAPVYDDQTFLVVADQ